MRTRLAVVLVLAACLSACDRVERLDVPSAQQAEHTRLQTAERSLCIERLAAIRAELATLGDHAWAGEYTWRHQGSCGNYQEGEGIALAPAAGVVWWFMGDGPEYGGECDYGDVVSVDAEHIIVRWTIGTHSPHHSGEPDQPLLLDGDLVRVRWGKAELLVPACRMPAFCGGVSSGAGGLRIRVPRRGGWVSSPGDLDFWDPPSGDWPEVPARWNGYLVHAPIRVRAVMDRAPRIVGAFGPRPWKDDSPTLIWSVTASIEAGSDQRVLPEMQFFVDAPTGHSPYDIRNGRVVHLERDSAQVEFRGWTWLKEGPPKPISFLSISTRDPSAQ